METPVHNTSSTKNNDITTSQPMKNGRLRRGKLTGQFNIAWIDQNLLRKHYSNSRLIAQIDHSLDHRTPATPQHHIQNKQQVPNRSQINATSQGQVQKIQDNNDNISGRQVLITPTSETKMKDHPDPTGDNNQENGKDNDRTPSNNKSKACALLASTGEARLDPTHPGIS
ncbi:hypothetical protein H5410_046198 [Solanum commersonii]|uniref:Uncharacterized protein n=1 Tax=Solanum commersonii TaxID=4109 RepID=A0A9J5XEW1_SOLCO|nr:hypothetical protein H5410_046198 [Solanum commersonii]